MAVDLTSIRLDKRLADEAAEVLGVKSRTEAVHPALREIVAEALQKADVEIWRKARILGT